MSKLYAEGPAQVAVLDPDELREIYNVGNIYERVIRLSKMLEQWLKSEMDAHGKGLCELVESAERVWLINHGRDSWFAKVARSIRKIAKIRNKLVHQPGPLGSDDEEDLMWHIRAISKEMNSLVSRMHSEEQGLVSESEKCEESSEESSQEEREWAWVSDEEERAKRKEIIDEIEKMGSINPPKTDNLCDIFEQQNIYEQVIRLSKTLEHWLREEWSEEEKELTELVDSIAAIEREYTRDGQMVFVHLFQAIREVSELRNRLLHGTDDFIRCTDQVRFHHNFEIILQELALHPRQDCGNPEIPVFIWRPISVVLG